MIFIPLKLLCLLDHLHCKFSSIFLPEVTKSSLSCHKVVPKLPKSCLWCWWQDLALCMNDIMETDRGRPPWGVGREKTALKTLNIYKRTKISYNIDKLQNSGRKLGKPVGSHTAGTTPSPCTQPQWEHIKLFINGQQRQWIKENVCICPNKTEIVFSIFIFISDWVLSRLFDWLIGGVLLDLPIQSST